MLFRSLANPAKLLLLEAGQAVRHRVLLLVVLGQSVSRTRDEVEQLGTRVEEVDHLGDEEEEQCLGEMSQYCNNSKSHACNKQRSMFG